MNRERRRTKEGPSRVPTRDGTTDPRNLASVATERDDDSECSTERDDDPRSLASVRPRRDDGQEGPLASRDPRRDDRDDDPRTLASV